MSGSERSRTGAGRQGGERGGMKASESGDRNRSDRLSGRSSEELDSEERNAGSKPGWDDRSADL